MKNFKVFYQVIGTCVLGAFAFLGINSFNGLSEASLDISSKNEISTVSTKVIANDILDLYEAKKLANSEEAIQISNEINELRRTLISMSSSQSRNSFLSAPAAAVPMGQITCPEIQVIELTDVPGFSQTDLLMKCGDPDTLSFLIFIEEPGNISGTQMSLAFDQGMQYAGFESTHYGAPTTISNVNPNPSNPKFLLEGITEGVFIAYIGAEITCDADITALDYEIDAQFNFIFEDPLGQFASCRQDLTIDHSYNDFIKEPDLAIVGRDLTINTLGQRKCVRVDMIQGGLPPTYWDSIHLQVCDLDLSGTLKFDENPIRVWTNFSGWSPPVPIGDWTYDPSANLFDFGIGSEYMGADGRTLSNQAIYVEMCYIAEDCPVNPTQTVRYKANYGCGGDMCKSVFKQQTIKVAPTAKIKPIASASLEKVASICGEPAEIKVIIASGLNSADEPLVFPQDSALGLYTDLKFRFEACGSSSMEITEVVFNAGTPDEISLDESSFEWNDDDIVIDLSNNVIDLDGMGGMIDADNDGFFDDLAGGTGIEFIIKLDFKCSSTPDPTSLFCNNLDCSFAQIFIEGKRDCGTPFEERPFVGPFDIQYGGTYAAGDSLDLVASNNRIFLGTTGRVNGSCAARAIQRTEVEFKYVFNKNDNVIGCDDNDNFLQIIFEGSPILVYDIDFNPADDISVSVDGGATNTISAADAMWTDINTSTRMVSIPLGDAAIGDTVRYFYTIEADSARCAPNQYMTGTHQVIESCNECDCDITKACGEIRYYTNPEDCMCPCEFQDTITQIYRKNVGYADKLRTTYADLEVGNDKTFLPGDTMFLETAHIPKSEEVLSGIYTWSFLYELLGPTLTYNGVKQTELAIDGARSEMLGMYFKKKGGTTKTFIDFSEIAACQGSSTYGEWGGMYMYFGETPYDDVSTNLYDSNLTAYAASTYELYDNSQLRLNLYNHDELADCRGTAKSVAYKDESTDCLSEFIAHLGFEVDDTLFVQFHLPLIKNPLRVADLYNEDKASPTMWTWSSVTKIDPLDASCTTAALTCRAEEPIITTCPDSIFAKTSIDFTACGGTVEHLFYVVEAAPLGYFSEEWRPYYELQDITVPIYSPMVYCGNARAITASGKEYPLTVKETTNHTCQNVCGEEYCTVSSGSFGTITFNPYEDGYEGLAIGKTNQAPCMDSVRIVYDLCKICEVDINTEGYSITYDYKFPSDGPIPELFVCHRTSIGTGNELDGCNYDGSNGVNYYNDLNLDTLYYKNDRVAADVIAPPPTTSFPSLSTSLNTETCGVAVITSDVPGNSEELNCIKVCAGTDGTETHVGVVTSITVPSSVGLINIYDDATPTPNIIPSNIVAVSATHTTYSISLGDLEPDNCHNIQIGSTLLFCPEAPAQPEMCVSSTSGCLDPKLLAALAPGTSPCNNSNVCYQYTTGETGLQGAFLNPTGSHELCDIISFAVLIKNTNETDLTDIIAEWVLPTAGMEVILTSFEASYPNCGDMFDADGLVTGDFYSIDPPIINGNHMIYPEDQVWSPQIHSFGLPNLVDVLTDVDPDNDCDPYAVIRFQAITTCDEFVSGSRSNFNVTAKDPCGPGLVEGQDLSEQIIIDGAHPNDFAQILVTAKPSEAYCDAETPEFTVTGQNISEVASGDSVQICFTFPENINYQPGSAYYAIPSGQSVGTEVISTIGNSTVVCIAGYNNMPIGGAFTIKFNADFDTDTPCGDYKIGVDIKELVEDVACASDPTGACDVYVQTSVNPDFTLTLKGPMEIADLKMYKACSVSEDPVTMEYEAVLVNHGPPSSNIRIDLHDDILGNEVLDYYDPVLDSDTHTDLVETGDTITLTGTFEVAAINSCPVLLNFVFESICVCNYTTFPFSSLEPAWIADLPPTTILCPGQELELNTCGDFEIVYSPAENIIERIIGDNIFLDVVDASIVTSITVTGMEGECGYTVTKFLRGFEDFDMDLVIDEGCEFQDLFFELTIPTEYKTGTTISWSPATYLDDANRYDPIFNGPAGNYSYTVDLVLGDGCVKSSTVSFEIFENGIVLIDGETEFCDGYQPATINATSGYDYYEWYKLDGGFEILKSLTFINEWAGPTEAGDYIVKAYRSTDLCPAISGSLAIAAKECVDLELTKNAVNFSDPFTIGSTVTYELAVCNINDPDLGMVFDATNVQVLDQLPGGVSYVTHTHTSGSYSPGSNEWDISVIENGTCDTLWIDVTVNEYGCITNTAQISEGDNEDIDSTPNNDDGDQSEDDEDNGKVTVDTFDLALKKVLDPMQTMPVTIGSTVRYDIEVCNQGTIDAYNIEVVDYIPAGMTVTDANWTVGTVTNEYFRTITGPITVGNCMTIEIICKVSALPVSPSTSYTNYAEISSAEDKNGENPPDIDSSPDNDPNNDGTVVDDITDNTNGDQDDHDPAQISVIMVECMIASNSKVCPGTTLTMEEIGTNNTMWSWSGPNGFSSTVKNPALNPATAGVYIVTVTDNNGLTSNCEIEIELYPTLALEGDITNVSCNGLSDGEVDITVTGGAGPFQFDWEEECPITFTKGATGIEYTLVNDLPHVYSTNVTYSSLTDNSIGTGTMGENFLSQHESAVGQVYLQANYSCPVNVERIYIGGGNLDPWTFDLQVYSAVAYTLEYSNDGSTWNDTGMSFTGPDGDFLQVEVLPSAISAQYWRMSSTQEAGWWTTSEFRLEGNSIGSGGTDTADQTGLPAGVYCLLVTDANGCQVSGKYELTEPILLTCTSAGTDLLCNGDNSGTITASAAGGTTPYTYSVDGGAFQSGATFSGLAAGMHTVVTKDANGCESDCDVMITEPEVLSCTVNIIDDTSCIADNGSVEVIAVGGTTGYMYSLDGVTFQTMGIFIGLGAGSYTLTVRDVNGCTTTCAAVLTSPSLPICDITAQTHISCNGATDGAIVVDGSLGSGSYEFSLNGGAFQMSGSFTDLAAGTYTVTVRNADTPTCTSKCSVTLTEPTAISCTTTGTSVLCNGEADGIIIASATGGDGNYDYSINGGATYQINTDFTGLVAGMYTVTVRDNGDDQCTSTCAYLVTEPALLSCSLVSTSVLCNGDATGTIIVTATGGQTPYNYSLDGAPYQPGNAFQGISAGQHTVTVQDKNGCITMCSVTITEPPVLECTTTSTDATDCNVEDGTITVTGTGGVPGYEYSIENGSYQSSNIFTGLMAGTHIVSTKDANGCVTTCEAFIDAPNTPMCQIVAVDHVDCFGASTGSVAVTGSGGNPPYEFSIDNATWQPTGLFENLAAGMHAIYIRNNTSPMCTSMCAVEIEQPEELTCLLTPNDPLCNGGADGNITTIATEGTMPYEYSVNGGAWQPGHVFMGLTAGDYTVTIRDGNDCLKTCDVTLGEPTQVECTTAVVDLLCNDDESGQITVSATGGVPAYDYNLNGGFWQDSPLFIGLSGGVYTVNIRDENDCVSTCMAIVNEPPALVCNLVELVPESCAFNDGSIEVNATGGTAPVTYSIDGGTTTQATGLFADLTLGVYTITITDANGCIKTCEFEVLPDCFDLALTKKLVTPGPYSYGMKVVFDIQVINQGNVNATNVEVTDHVPCGFMYDPSTLLNLSNDWTLFSTAFPMTTIASLDAQSSTTVQIELIIQECTDADGHTNVSEISQAFDEDGNPGDDVDSDPDFDPNNDNGGEPNGPTDDQEDGNGTDDEDDHDPAFVAVYDLAMTKMLVTPEPYAYGDVLEFAIEVCNQAANPVQNIEIADYVPVGYSYDAGLNAGWMGSGPTPTTLTYTYTTPLLAGGECVTIPLFLTLEMAGGTDDWKNVSEISSFEDEDGMEQDDVDSTPDDNPDNDGDMEDDATDGTNGDEDDSDFAGPEVVDAALVKTTTDMGPFSYGDMVTFDFEISNQGNVDLYNVVVNDFIPCGYAYIGSNSPLWIFNSGSSIAMTTLEGPIAPGTSETLSITLEVQACSGSAASAWTNIAEIESFENEDGDDITEDDIDSDGDDDPTNDPTEDNVDDNTNGDEDDNDPETIEVFDLAQIKTVVTPTPYAYGDLLEYSIVVTNQGNVTAQNITITDNLPAGFSYDQTDNAGWDATNAPAYTYTYAGPLAPGETVSIPLFVTIEMTMGGMDNYTNISEISSAEDDEGNPGDDADSDPDDDPDNDGDPTDNATDDPDDEDDHDPEVITVVDAALVKTTTDMGPFSYGDMVTFDFEISNQGNVDLYNVVVNDFIPCGYKYIASNTPLWNFDSGSSIAMTTLAGPIVAGTSETLSITLEVQACPGSAASAWTNVAEIESFENEDGDDITEDDIDSDGDDDPTNDPTEDNVDDNTNGDEDDNDPETIEVFDLAQIKTVVTPTPYAYGDLLEYSIAVTNQGNVTAQNITLTDHLPAGFSFDAADNAGWDATNAPAYTYTYAGPLVAGETVSIPLFVILEMTTGGMDNYTNISEISDAEDEDGNPGDDADSNPDDDPENDGDPIDDETEDPDDEDDHDPEHIEIVDLALVKTTTYTAPIQYGDVIPFTIEVINQGNVTAQNVELVDYFPCGYDYSAMNNPEWSFTPALGGPGVLFPEDGYATTSITGPIAPGASETVTIYMIVQPCADPPADYTNTAEITSMEDENGNDISADDIDSTPDDDPDNDDETDNVTDGTDGDEDDADPETPMIFDLALTKSLAAGQVTPVSLGDDVTFVITVYNQGNITAANVDIIDYLPAGFALSANDTNGWTDADADGNPENTIAGPIAPNGSIVLQIVVEVLPATSTDDYINVAEITGSEDDMGNDMSDSDIDSMSDDNEYNDNGDGLGTDDDDATDGNGQDGNDEDDQDPATVPVQYFDLALTKMLAPGQAQQVMPGADVTFIVTVVNQGTIDAYNVDIVDYLPADLTLSAADTNGWVDSDADGNPENTIAGPIAGFGGVATIEIVVTVNPGVVAPAMLTNVAEISDAEDVNGDSQDDVDSTADDDDSNDPFGDDNQTDGDGTDDEDDSDPAVIEITDEELFDLALSKTLDPSQVTPVYVGDDITFFVTVTNQGTVTAQNIEISDYMGASLDYSNNDTNGWVDSDNDGVYENLIPGPVAPGQSVTIPIICTVIAAPTSAEDLLNIAEITAAEDEDGNHPEDVDSTADTDPNNDSMNEDDNNETEEDGKNGGDEDDHDWEEVPFGSFDLALTKMLSPTQPMPIMPGDDVTFNIKVYNQGTVDAFNVDIVEYTPAGLSLSVADYNGWVDSDNDGNYEMTIAGIDAGECLEVDIVMTIDPSATGSLTNYAEISDAEDENGNHPVDNDSTPDDDPNNDKEGDDNQTDGNGTDDEDDHDPETITLGSWDLALTKQLAPGQSAYVMPGDDVTFVIEVTNQGTMAAFNIDVVEYVPAGMTYSTADTNGWTDVDNDGVLENTIAGPLAPGASQSIFVTLTIDASFSGTSIQNFAEISDFEDDMGNHPDDGDSDGDSDPNNDVVGDDNQTDGDGIDDEDDHDPEEVFISTGLVYDVALDKEIDPATMFPVYSGDDVTFLITVTNQSNADIQNVQIIDYLPTSLTLSMADSNGWFDSDSDGNPELLINTTLTPGQQFVIPIVVTIDPDFKGSSLENRAEISSFEDEEGDPQEDEDSTPDDDPDNDEEDEDDEDGDIIPISNFDLALRKTVAPNGAPSPIMPGDDVTFRIEVHNQGNVAAYNVDVVEYVPSGMTLSTADMNGWVDSDADGIYENTIPGPIVPGSYDFIDVVLTVDANIASPTSLENEAEISDAEDENGDHPEDSDSTSDDDPDNDGDPTDNDIDGTDGDEDDNDIESIDIFENMFDLALRKTISPEFEGGIQVGEDIPFDIWVFNQGNLTATNIEITEHMPLGSSISVNDTNGWTDFDNDNVYEITIAGPLAPGDSVLVEIILTLDTYNNTNELINYAEISGADDVNGDPITDIDSDPDGDNTNDNGGDPYDDTNDEIGDDGTIDEDDHDPAVFQIVDVALLKTTTDEGPFSYGDQVTFDIEVSNQGNVDLYNVAINDFIPCGYTYLASNDATWTYDAATSVATTTLAGPIARNGSVTVSITMEIIACETQGAWTNTAEIGSMEDENGEDITDEDIDSNADNDPTNDSTEDNVDDNTNGDEDDNDPETIEVFDLALIKTVVTDPPYAFGQDITFEFVLVNQGNVAATNVEITDHLPAGFVYNATDNPEWDASAAPDYTYIVTDVLVMGDTVRVPFVAELQYIAGGLENYTNVGEISGAEDDMGGDRTDEDADSDADGDPDNDNGGEPDGDTDDQFDGDGTDDEDDHDPALVPVIDVALVKTTSAVGPFTYGQNITFDIEVFNQGALDLYNVKVNDFIPCGYKYLSSNDGTWTFNPVSEVATTVIEGPIVGQTSQTVSITLEIAPCSGPANYTNVAEIESMEDESGTDVTDFDIDSQGDNDPTNDETDDNTNDNTNGDEDDNDPESIEIFDLALIKEIVTEPMYEEGDVIEFVITVVNQGTMTAANIQVADHLPIGFSYNAALNPGWDDAAAPSYYYAIPGTLAPSDTVRVSFFANILFVQQLQENYTNYAEISGATDVDGNGVTDADSNPDNDPNNDGTPVDDQFNDRGDEDDHDPEDIDLTEEFIVPCNSDCEIQCIGQLNVSLDEDCMAVITPAMGGVGIEAACNDFYLTPTGEGLIVFDQYGNAVPDRIVGIDHIGQNLTYQITEPQCGNKCWGNILVEYKLPPQIECPEDLTLTCAGADALGLPRATGGCLGLTFDVRLVDEVTDRLECDPDYTQRIVRTYRAEDELGNFVECSHEILVQRVDLTQVIFPDNTVISCSDSGYQFLPNGAPVPYISSVFPTGSGSAGVPIVCDPGLTSGLLCPTATGSGSFAAPLIPIGGATMLDSLGNIVLVEGATNQLCNSVIQYTDVEIPSTGCRKKYLRTFEVTEWWCNGDNSVGSIQQIEIIDDVAPTITCPADFTVSTDDDCAGSVTLPAIDAVDDCGGNGVIVSVDYPLGFLNTNGGEAVLEVGNNLIRYIVADSCYNDTTCTINVLVTDLTEPVAICESHTVVGISQSGNSFLFAEAIDDGSWDECGLDRFEVARMDTSCVAQDTLFDDKVAFCCTDVGQEVMVIFRAIDKGGNHNDCMVRVEVQDKQVPLVTCPPNDTIDCRVPYDLNNLSVVFGGPNLNDNCPSTQNIVEDVTADVNQCGIGTIFRKLNLLDTDNVTILRQCVQTITITNDTPFLPTQIQWPLDIDTTGACMISGLNPEDLPAIYGFPTFLGGDDNCSLLGYDYEDKVFTTTGGSGECARIERTWTVINWCDQSTGGFAQFTDPNGPQMISLTNSVAPVIATQGEVIIESGNIDCESGLIEITRTATDDCPNPLDWAYTIRDTDNNIVGSGDSATLVDTLFAGNYTVTWTVNDFCGNTDIDVQDLRVINTKTPTPVCINGLSGMLVGWDSTGDGVIDSNTFELWASDVDGGSYHTCNNDIVLSFAPDTSITNITFDCDSIGIRPIRLYVTDVETGMQDYCSTFINVQDNGNCPTTTTNLVAVEGEVHTEEYEKVDKVEVGLGNTGIMDMTEEDGLYAFRDMPMGGSYAVAPTKDIDYLNGVSTLDIIVIQRHILNQTPFTSAYKMIAADVNNSKDVSAIDLIELRKLILGVYDELPNNDSWRFVDAEHTFADVLNPWLTEIPEDYLINNLNSNMKIDFVGVKVGDVNGSVIANSNMKSLDTRSSRWGLEFTIEKQQVQKGEIHTAYVRSGSYEDINGWQGTIEFDTDKIEVLELRSDKLDWTADNYNMAKQSEGWVSMSYHDAKARTVAASESVFEIRYRAKEDITTDGLFAMTSLVTPQEGYRNNQIVNVDLRYVKSGNAEIIAVVPNPWIEQATIEFYMPETAEVRWEFYDVTGRLLYMNKDVYSAGDNSMLIKRNDIKASGIVYAKMITDTHTSEYKMMLVD